MVKIKEGGEEKRQSMKNIIPLLVLVVVIFVLGLYKMGYLHSDYNFLVFDNNTNMTYRYHIDSGFKDFNSYFVGKNYIIQYVWNSDNGAGSDNDLIDYYIGSGSLPKGMTLLSNGKLKGVSNKIGVSKFEVCVKDKAGNKIGCESDSLNILDHKISSVKCPLTSCEANSCCSDTMYDPTTGQNAETATILTYASCPCPSDTTETGIIDSTTTPGITWKLCHCK